MMNKKIDYSISDKMEKKPVGYIKDCFTGECLEYYCEKKLLEEYEKEYLNNEPQKEKQKGVMDSER